MAVDNHNNSRQQTVFQLAPQDPGVKREKPGGGDRAPKARVSSAVGARIEAPRGVGCGEGKIFCSRLGGLGERRKLHLYCFFGVT